MTEKIIEEKYNADLKMTEKTIETTTHIYDLNGNIIKTYTSIRYEYKYDKKPDHDPIRIISLRNPRTGKRMTFYRKNNK